MFSTGSRSRLPGTVTGSRSDLVASAPPVRLSAGVPGHARNASSVDVETIRADQEAVAVTRRPVSMTGERYSILIEKIDPSEVAENSVFGSA